MLTWSSSAHRLAVKQPRLEHQLLLDCYSFFFLPILLCPSSHFESVCLQPLNLSPLLSALTQHWCRLHCHFFFSKPFSQSFQAWLFLFFFLHFTLCLNLLQYIFQAILFLLLHRHLNDRFSWGEHQSFVSTFFSKSSHSQREGLSQTHFMDFTKNVYWLDSYFCYCNNLRMSLIWQWSSLFR